MSIIAAFKSIGILQLVSIGKCLPRRNIFVLIESSSQSKPPSSSPATTTTNRPTYYNKFAKQQEVEAKENEIEEAIENASNKTVKESEKEANVIGDSESRIVNRFSYWSNIQNTTDLGRTETIKMLMALEKTGYEREEAIKKIMEDHKESKRLLKSDYIQTTS